MKKPLVPFNLISEYLIIPAILLCLGIAFSDQIMSAFYVAMKNPWSQCLAMGSSVILLMVFTEGSKS